MNHCSDGELDPPRTAIPGITNHGEVVRSGDPIGIATIPKNVFVAEVDRTHIWGLERSAQPVREEDESWKKEFVLD